MPTLTYVPDALGDLTEATVDHLADAIAPWFERIAEAGNVPVEEIPDAATVRHLLDALFTNHGGRLRPRKTLAKKADALQRSAFALHKWHASGGYIGGLFAAKWDAGDRWPEVETFGAVLLASFGRSSSAIDRWVDTGLVGGAS